MLAADRRPHAKSILALVVAGALLFAGCTDDAESTDSTSSTATFATLPTSPPSTLPERKLRVELDKFFASKGGKDLMSFIRITARLNVRPTLTRAECQPIMLEMSAIGTPDYFLATATKIPDPYLSRAWQDEIAAKRLYLAGCDTSTQLPPDTPDRIKPKYDALVAEMSKHGREL